MGALNFSSESFQELDRWLLLAENLNSAGDWLREHFIEYKQIETTQFILAPIFDPTDQFHLKVVTRDSHIRGQIFYEFIDITPNYVSGSTALKELVRQTKKRRDPAKTFISPRPEPEENTIDRLDLRGRWISPDATIHYDCDDLRSLSDVPGWLAPKKRICDGCRSGVGTWCRKAQRDLASGQMDYDATLARVQRRTL